jgi:hypothetical protein
VSIATSYRLKEARIQSSGSQATVAATLRPEFHQKLLVAVLDQL